VAALSMEPITTQKHHRAKPNQSYIHTYQAMP